VSSGAQIGIRETRRSVGEYVLSAEDIRTGTQFPDVIARGVQEEFVHGYGTDPVFCPPHDVPYRSLLPRGPRNLIMSGRCISLSGHAAKLHSPRTQETCMAIGQAAGIAAALAAAQDADPRRVDVNELQRRLVARGANLGDLDARASLPLTGRPSETTVALEGDVVRRPSALTLSGHED
jgi:FAD dependent oxidoreductase